MNARAYYNEHDGHAADWIERLIAAGRIAPGIVDRRSIVDVRAGDLAGFVQCHFFAGIGVWSAALREAGWPDDRPVWTGSCPCQPLSGAGQRKGHADERHLWPAFHGLIAERRPATVLGEQVASADGREWLCAVRLDLEALGYAVGAADLCAAGAGVDFGESAEGAATLEWIRGAVLSCPDPFLAAGLSGFAAWAGAGLGYGPAHIRQRLYWVADADQRQRGRIADSERCERDGTPTGWQQGDGIAQSSGDARTLADASDARPFPGAHPGVHRGEESARPRNAKSKRHGDAGELGHAVVTRFQEQRRLAGISRNASEAEPGQAAIGAGASIGELADARHDDGAAWTSRSKHESASPVGEGFTSDGVAHGSNWIICTDGKARPTQPGILPLAHAWSGSSRVAVLRAAGNAIVKACAVRFIEAAQEAIRRDE